MALIDIKNRLSTPITRISTLAVPLLFLASCTPVEKQLANGIGLSLLGILLILSVALAPKPPNKS